jgi:ankyrin repeat protein
MQLTHGRANLSGTLLLLAKTGGNSRSSLFWECRLKIHQFAEQGNDAGVAAELANGVPVDMGDERGWTPLAYAASSSAATDSTLQVLLAAGADASLAVEGGKQCPIGLAACSSKLEKIQALLAAGANVNAAAPHGYTPLLHAIYALHDSDALVVVAEQLLKADADPNCETTYGESPLTVASRLGRFDVIKLLLQYGADPDELQWTKLIEAVACGTNAEVTQRLEAGDPIGYRDRWKRSALMVAALVGDVQKVEQLRQHGADIDDHNAFEGTALMLAAERNRVTMVGWLIAAGADVNATNDSGTTALILASQAGAASCVELLLKAGADAKRENTYRNTAIQAASNERTVRLLVDAGEDIGGISPDMRRELTGLVAGEGLAIARATYLNERHRRFGVSNGERMTHTFWRSMVQAGIPAYQARQQFGDTNSLDQPVWCFSRFGMSFTELPDGRYVQIGGEHEDSYDPDFCIYNEVVVHQRNGDLEIFGYPEGMFPPTDFHTATFVNGYIYVIGGLGYRGSRAFSFTPVYRLNCASWTIESLPTRQSPGWIYNHRTRVEQSSDIVITGGKMCRLEGGSEEHVENEATYRLNLPTLRWTKQ